MFKNKKIGCFQKITGQRKETFFEPDSSFQAWEHYKKVYSQNEYIRENYELDKPCFYRYLAKAKGDFKYINKKEWDSSKANRLVALEKGTKTKVEGNKEYFVASYRLGGDCDFNFNDGNTRKKGKYQLFSEIIGRDKTASSAEKAIAREMLENCKKMHHTLLNFSLMQVRGNLQGYKSKGHDWLDRLDTFVSELDKYFKDLPSVFQDDSFENRVYLESFLEDFNDIYNYCKTFYFIEDRDFVDKLIEQGNLPITNTKELIRYMSLANEFWEIKENAFLKNELSVIDGYFKNGGETYSRDELISKIKNDFGYETVDINELIEKCIEKGFFINCGNDVYTI